MDAAEQVRVLGAQAGWSWWSRTLAGVGTLLLWAGFVLTNWHLAQFGDERPDPLLVLSWCATGITFFMLFAVGMLSSRRESPLIAWSVTVVILGSVSGLALLFTLLFVPLDTWTNWPAILSLPLTLVFGILATARWVWPRSAIPTILGFTVAPIVYLAFTALLLLR